jgi:hypothetical protein
MGTETIAQSGQVNVECMVSNEVKKPLLGKHSDERTSTAHKKRT